MVTTFSLGRTFLVISAPPWSYRDLVHRVQSGHFYFTKLLLPALLQGAKTSKDGKARVVNTSSISSILASPIDYNTLKDGPARRKCWSVLLYGQSKLVRPKIPFHQFSHVDFLRRVTCSSQTSWQKDMGTRASCRLRLTLEI